MCIYKNCTPTLFKLIIHSVLSDESNHSDKDDFFSCEFAIPCICFESIIKEFTFDFIKFGFNLPRFALL